MKRNRIIYVIAVLITLLLFLLSSKTYILVLFILGVVYPLLAYLVLKSEAKHIELLLKVKSACTAKTSLDFQIVINSKRKSLASANIAVLLECENVKFNEREESQIVLSPEEKVGIYNLKFTPSFAGITYIHLKEALMTDLFLILGIPIKQLESKSILVYPQNVLLNVDKRLPGIGNNNGDNNELNKRGNNLTEIFDMREYAPGDDIRLVHWKLTSKFDRMILKEGSKSVVYDTMVVFDFGFMCKEKPVDKERIAKTIDIGLAICEKFIYQNVSYQVGFICNEKLNTYSVSSVKEYISFLEDFLAAPIQRETGEALYYMEQEEYRRGFTKLVYISNDVFDERLTQIGNYIDITAVTVDISGDELKMTQKGYCEIIEMPYEGYEENIYSIKL